jgi:protein-disulfide isomerase
MEKTSSSKKTFSILNNQIVQLVLIVMLVVAAFMIGSLVSKVKTLEKGTGTTTQATGTTAQPAQPKVDIAQIKSAFGKATIKFGDGNGKLTILEVSDPSCPYCQIAGGMNSELNSQSDQFKLVADGGTYVAPVPEIKKLVDQGQASFALIYSPGHGNGEMGMRALYCAFEMGKFWEADALIMSSAGYNLMNNTVKNDKTKSGAVADFLSSVVDSNKMKTCIDSGKYDSQLSSEPSLASSIGISGTPGFYINTTLFAGAYSFKDMQSIVDAALATK